jgi:imidazole glycerol-phosphate synthase subunit HisF
MLKKRLIGVVTVKNGWAVQSFGYRKYLPLGKAECLVENLDRWGADEILVQVIDRSLTERGPDFELLEKLGYLGLGTPLIYSGGIRTVEDGVKVIQSGADRLVVDALLHDDLAVVNSLGVMLGKQAIIASLPMSIETHGPELYNYRTKSKSQISEELTNVIEHLMISEILLTDWKNEGYSVSFDDTLVDLFPFQQIPLITFGGISCAEQVKTLFTRSNVVAVAVGNFLNYREHSIQTLKDTIAGVTLRPSSYATQNSLQADV